MYDVVFCNRLIYDSVKVPLNQYFFSIQYVKATSHVDKAVSSLYKSLS